MSPQEALQILDQIAGIVQLKRADWQNVQTALMVLQQFINENQNPIVPLEDRALRAEQSAANSNDKGVKQAAKDGKK